MDRGCLIQAQAPKMFEIITACVRLCTLCVFGSGLVFLFCCQNYLFYPCDRMIIITIDIDDRQ